MSEQLYRYLRVPDEAVDFDCHQYVSTWMVPITEELLTRAEWEASVNYNYILDWAIDVGGLNYRPDMQEIKDVVATALNVEEDS